MSNTAKYFELIKTFQQQLDEVRPSAVAEIETKIQELTNQLDAREVRQGWNDLLVSYKPTDEQIEQAKIVFPQILSKIDPVAQSYYGVNINFLISWFIEQRQGNYLKDQEEKIANGILCAGLGKVEAGLFNFDLSILHERHAYRDGFCYFLDNLMPKQTKKQLAYLDKLQDELKELQALLAEIEATATKSTTPEAA